MNVLFEEDGAFRAGVVLADNNTSLQVELPGGKRAKVKAAHVLLRFESPSAADLMGGATAAADTIDTDFLWEACGGEEFSFDELAVEYHGPKPGPVNSAAVLLRLHSAPMYFHRKGRGRYRKAPPEILQAALAGLEKKRQQAAAIERMTADLVAGVLPEEFNPILPQLMYQPDRNRGETKAFEAACAQTGLSAAALLQRCGAIHSTHDYHLGRFLFEFFPETQGGARFPPFGPAALIDELPLAGVEAFSIDDAATTEIDDALSIVPTAGGGWRIGIHIAAPGLGIAPQSDLGRIARERLSTVYMPGRKITMLPEDVVEQFTLAAGRTVPSVSLYMDVAADYRLLGHETRLERVPIVANLRHHEIEPVFNAATLAAGLPEFPYRDELQRLWEFAEVLEAGRGKSSQTHHRKDYNFSVDWTVASGRADEAGYVSITDRERGSPLDTLVAELMIFANSTWGAMLRDAGIPALYRVQTAGKVRMSTVAAPHEGLGVDCYAWSSSPLRRYCDLVNQWQLIALLHQTAPPFPPKSGELLAAMRDFDASYTAYADFQRGMERYWCLRWLLQEQATTVEAHVIKESLVRLEQIPLVLRVPSLPDEATVPRGARVRLSLGEIDLLAAELSARFLELAPRAASDGGFEDDLDEEAAE
jgi:exoribonuclease-2